jgi:hypothetical protein
MARLQTNKRNRNFNQLLYEPRKEFCFLFKILKMYNRILKEFFRQFEDSETDN